jgi:phospholipase D1/2
MVTEDTKLIDSHMNGVSTKVSEFASSLRRSLFMEHFALDEEAVADPLSDNLWNEINARAQHNTEIYRLVFRCYPDDEIDRLSIIEEWAKQR